LKSKGYRVLRFWNNDILKDIDSVLRVIFSALNEIQNRQGENP